MIEQDTIKLLRECDAGIKMGVTAIDEVVEKIESEDFKAILTENRNKHIELGHEIEHLLADFNDEGKEPPAIAEIMSKIKTSIKLTTKFADKAAADIITDGGNMGIKSLSRYLNQYKAADEKSKNITEKLIKLETDLVSSVRIFL
ncbi:MAG: hypothetical protein LBL93_00605 [Ruminococcus sp.]|nr:hypothetical protein [Ruminococcus sp.]